MPSARPMRSVVPRCSSRSEARRNSSTETPSPIGMSRRMLPEVRATGAMRAQMPRMTKTLKRFEPTTLPTAMSLLCAMAERTETVSSGVEVPTAMTVRPTTNSGMRRRCATAAAPSVRKLAPPRISPRPARSRRMSISFSSTSCVVVCFSCRRFRHSGCDPDFRGERPDGAGCSGRPLRFGEAARGYASLSRGEKATCGRDAAAAGACAKLALAVGRLAAVRIRMPASGGVSGGIAAADGACGRSGAECGVRSFRRAGRPKPTGAG